MHNTQAASPNQGILSFFQGETAVKEDAVERDEDQLVTKRSSPVKEASMCEVQCVESGSDEEVAPVDIIEVDTKENCGEESAEGVTVLEDAPPEEQKTGTQMGENRRTRSKAVKKEPTEIKKQANKEQLELKKRKEREERELKKLKEKEERELKKQREKEERESKKLREKEERELKRQKQKEERELKKQREKEERELKKQKEKEERELKKQLEKEERERKEEEKQKRSEAKERAQLKIGNFFKKTVVSKSLDDSKSDYDRAFLPFYIKRDVKVAYLHQLDREKLQESETALDGKLQDKGAPQDTLDWLASMRPPTCGYEIRCTAVEVLQEMTAKQKTDEELQKLLRQVPHKYIKFYENIRPPYIGTYSKKVTLPRCNPFSTEGTGFNYDYDSDLDWINDEDEEGGDVDDLEADDDDDEEDEQDQGDEHEFDGFLDSDDDSGSTSKKSFAGPLIPVVHLVRDFDNLKADEQQYFNMLAVQYLIEAQPFPIDPNYVPNKRPNPRGVSESTTSPEHGQAQKKAKNLISDPKDLLKLLDEVHDSTFSLGTISEIVQKHVPHYTKETIKNTVKHYAARSSGKGNTSRKWQVIDVEGWEQLKVKH
ncbi:AaceriADL028Wp [[Ashbya] aceris (nom. inval.)]|nr:AaceriADL028Wp [[Ashbya] aceris (nom. inval.)]